ncbi:MAG: HypC/HybG/HupF family hydrogenase formation chaperone [Clostridiales bacterium]|nr:HypC/HybG/HupF family hydrogenase formation chaperone [Clostridiales bacterium]
MCVAAPGLVRSLDNNIAKIDYSGNIVEANAGLVKVEPGDYVLVHAGLVIQKINEREAKEMTELFNTLEELGNA